MTYSQTTQVPNAVFDAYLPQLGEAELKVLLVIIRQTYGWVDKSTGQRKTRDRISSSQFQRKTGYGRRTITSAIKSLCDRKLMAVTDYKGNPLLYASDRKGKSFLYYSPSLPAQDNAQAKAANGTKPAQGRNAFANAGRVRRGGMRQAGELVRRDFIIP